MLIPVESGVATMERLNEALNITCKLRKAKHNLENITGEQLDPDLRLLNHTTSILIETSCNWVRIDANYILLYVYTSTVATFSFQQNFSFIVKNA